MGDTGNTPRGAKFRAGFLENVPRGEHERRKWRLQENLVETFPPRRVARCYDAFCP